MMAAPVAAAVVVEGVPVLETIAQVKMMTAAATSPLLGMGPTVRMIVYVARGVRMRVAQGRRRRTMVWGLQAS
jgi:hypothetical protein